MMYNLRSVLKSLLAAFADGYTAPASPRHLLDGATIILLYRDHRRRHSHYDLPLQPS